MKVSGLGAEEDSLTRSLCVNESSASIRMGDLLSVGGYADEIS